MSVSRFSTAAIASTRSNIDTLSRGAPPPLRARLGQLLARRGEDVAAQKRALAELVGGLAIALVLEQARDQVALEFLGLLQLLGYPRWGSIENDLISSSVAAITRYSPATSRLSESSSSR